MAVAAKASIDEQSRLLDALISRAETHFHHEEALMQQMGYTGFDKHKAEHDMLLEEVQELQVRSIPVKPHSRIVCLITCPNG